jgi:hypothetical protein
MSTVGAATLHPETRTSAITTSCNNFFITISSGDYYIISLIKMGSEMSCGNDRLGQIIGKIYEKYENST